MRALRKARGEGGGEGRSLGVLTWALGSNFPLFLVYPLDMPEYCAHVCVCVIHWHCSAQLSMFNMEKHYRNEIIIIIIIIIVQT